jgi:hypothetical protein
MGARKKVKKKVSRKAPVQADVEILKSKILDLASEYSILQVKLNLAIEILKHYTKKDQIGDLANPAIELLTSWGISG